MDGAEANIFELRFAKELSDLRQQHQIGVEDLSAGELAAFVHAVEKVCSPFTDVNAELVEKPVVVCKGVWFWPPTAGAQIWLDEYAAKWWPKKSMRYKWATVYALKNARDAEAFTALTDKWEAEKAIVKCALTLPVHGEELQDAINRAYGVGRMDAPRKAMTRAEKLKAQAETDFATVLARLEVQSGIPRRYWLWERSLVYTMLAYVQLHEFAAAFSACGGTDRARMLDELDDALKNLALVKGRIVDRIETERLDAKLAAERAESATEGNTDE